MSTEITPEQAAGCMRSAKKAIWVVAGLVGVIVLWSLVSGDDGPDPDMAIVMCHDAVRDRLRAPATARFPTFSETQVSQTENRFRVRSHVDAENAFGAMIRSNWDCVIEAEGGGAWRVISLDID